MSSFSLEQKLIQSIKNTLITAIKTSNLFKSLICCQLSFNLIQNYFHLADLLELSINKCLLLNDKRSKDLKSMAIYLIASNNQNINTIINDSNNSLYQECFIITLNHTPDHLANNLKSSKVASIIKGWIDNAEFNFNIFDSRSFHFNINHPSKLLYINQPLQDLDDHLDSYADKMMAVLTVLHQTPIIKYYDPFSTGTCLAARLAWRLQKKLDLMELPKVLPNDDKKNVDFIIIDRSSDPFSPLIHSYYYESSIHDLLNVDDFKRIGLNPDNPNENIMTLTENDQFYAKLRHTQVHQIHDEILKLINENPAAKAYFDSLNSQIPTKPNGDALASISGLMDQTLSIPEGQKIMEHKRLSDALASAIVNKQVALFAGLEQDISLNVATDPHKELQKLLLNDKIDVDDKLRLFLVYFIRYLFTKPEIIQAAQDQLGQVAVDGMEGIQVLFGKKPRPQNENHPEYRYTYKGWKSLNNIPKQASDEYEPVIGKIIEDILKNDGSPLVVPFKKTGSTDIDRTLSTLRGKGVVIPFSPQGFSATWGKLVPVDTQNMSGIDYLSHGRRTILFIIGGMTLSEIQAVHQLSTQYERSLIIGKYTLFIPRVH
ncbi:Sec1-like protein [Globomyces pollinis-pini]|nr:Sec1-like protein [Globomyces pollinis-pini]